jgi:hypothetical protein
MLMEAKMFRGCGVTPLETVGGAGERAITSGGCLAGRLLAELFIAICLCVYSRGLLQRWSSQQKASACAYKADSSKFSCVVWTPKDELKNWLDTNLVGVGDTFNRT